VCRQSSFELLKEPKVQGGGKQALKVVINSLTTHGEANGQHNPATLGKGALKPSQKNLKAGGGLRFRGQEKSKNPKSGRWTKGQQMAVGETRS